jgi:hypothetical protein
MVYAVSPNKEIERISIRDPKRGITGNELRALIAAPMIFDLLGMQPIRASALRKTVNGVMLRHLDLGNGTFMFMDQEAGRKNQERNSRATEMAFLAGCISSNDAILGVAVIVHRSEIAKGCGLIGEDEEQDNDMRAPDNLPVEEEEALANEAFVYAELENASRAEILNALHEFRERQRLRPRSGPLSRQEMVAAVNKDEYVEGIVAIGLDDLIDLDLETLNDKLSLLLTGDELLMDIRFEVVGYENGSLWMKVSGDAKEGVETEEIRCYVEDLVIYTQREAQAIRAASRIDPWAGWEAPQNAEAVYLLPESFEEIWEDGVVIPTGVQGTRRRGLWIDGPLSKETLQSLSDGLGGQRLWLALPKSDLLWVIPELATCYPLEDPLLAAVVQALAVEVVPPRLSDFGLTFIDCYQGYLIVRTGDGEFEMWPMLRDGRGIEQDLTGEGQVLEYQDGLYRYGATYATQAEIYPLIDKELSK